MTGNRMFTSVIDWPDYWCLVGGPWVLGTWYKEWHGLLVYDRSRVIGFTVVLPHEA